MTELDAGSLYGVRRLEGLAPIYGEAAAAVAFAKAYFLHNLQAMAPRIERTRYLFGEHISVADILLTTCLDWADPERHRSPEVGSRLPTTDYPAFSCLTTMVAAPVAAMMLADRAPT
jgi:glutathione S-transferase